MIFGNKFQNQKALFGLFCLVLALLFENSDIYCYESLRIFLKVLKSSTISLEKCLISAIMVIS
jgi:hypothetical protein